MIEWKEENGLLGQVNGITFYHIKIKPKNSAWRTMCWCDADGHRLKDYFLTVQEAKAKAEELLKEWLDKAGLIPIDQIFFCEECGDSGYKPSKYPMDNQGIELPQNCPCRQNPYSICSIREGRKK